MIGSSSEVGRMLHQEHLETLAAMNMLEELIHGEFRDRPPDISSDSARQQLGQLMAVIDNDIYRHFRFEEQHLFPVLAEVGMGEMTGMLIQEHNSIRSFAERMRLIAIRALEEGFDKATWVEFKEIGMDLAPSVMFHIQKEEMGVIRGLDVLLDGATDKELAEKYAGMAS